MKAIGLDIGTTTICGVVLDGKTGEVLLSRTLPNDTVISEGPSFEKKQDPEGIWKRICQILTDMAKEHPDVDSIGLTGQMHGILYVDAQGKAVSPLYTWQDESGNQLVEEPGDSGKTYARKLTEITGHFAASGFGLTTYYYHSCKNMVPETAQSVCTIMDYIGMRLTGLVKPVMHPSNAASFGVYDLDDAGFDTSKVTEAGMNAEFLPKVINGAAKIGVVATEIDGRKLYSDVPVSVALGDNQASVIGSVKDIASTVLVNVGTGSQISVGTDKCTTKTGMEIRPLNDKDYIYVGCGLCGGRAYALLEKFFEAVVTMAGGKVDGNLYGQMAKALAEAKAAQTDGLKVEPLFCGTRENPALRGSITGIGLENLTPAGMIRGFLYGIAEELFSQYEDVKAELPVEVTSLVGSGNGIRLNPALQKAFEDLFGMKLQIPAHTEEAAYGTALFSMVAAGLYDSLNAAQEIIQYQ